MWRGVGPSGLPMDRSMTSSPARRAAIFSSLVMLKTYGGRRLMRENSGITGFEGSLRFIFVCVCLSSRPPLHAVMSRDPYVALQNDYDSSVKISRDLPEGRNAFSAYGPGYV